VQSVLWVQQVLLVVQVASPKLRSAAGDVRVASLCFAVFAG